MSRECRTAETYYAIELYTLENSGIVLRNCCYDILRKVDTFCPLITLYINLDMHYVIAGQILARSNSLDSS